ncbi:MAG: class I SAM-dependent methyltransferase [Clostridiales bacterium]|jgi:SAM-dependent methyltransferase|nr:class I SAM-dependent methyltransferase [Clostridiales bacterium]
MEASYNIFSYYYDDLTRNINYRELAKYLDILIKKYSGKENGILLDLACGTGSISEEMSTLGYDVIGVDNSEEMLNQAIEKKFDSGLNIQYICQDMREIDMFGTIDITICMLDSINHLNSLEDVNRVFSKVSLFSEPDGLFIFDVNTKYKHEKVLANNVFIYETDDVYCVWENSYREETDEVNINLDFFERNGNMYKRYSESLSERAYDIADLDKALIDNKFEILAHYDGFSLNPPYNQSERIVFVARKVK